MATAKQVKDFIDKIAPLAVAECKKRGYGNAPAWTCVAQACLETGYGTSALMTKANAFFGIKATKAWKGKVYNSATKECYDGKTYVNVTACFRAYDNAADSVSDYFDLMNADRYKNSLTKTTVKGCITVIKAGGYATDPNYINSVVFVYENNKAQIEQYKVNNETNKETKMIKTNVELVNKAKEIATKYKTLYVMGGWGQPLNANNKTRAYNAYAYNRKADRWKMIQNASNDTFGFDCICLIKSIFWGFSGNKNAANGGATYASNGVPDISENHMINICKDVSTNFKKIVPGEMLYMPGHAGIYVGDGLAVECTPAWKNCVQITAVGNIGKKAGYSTRTWTKHGKFPYISYVGTDQTTNKVDPLSVYTDEQLANMVLLGNFGSGNARKQALGARYDAVQAIVNEMMKPVVAPKQEIYVVKTGDTLTAIAKKYGTTIAKLKVDNNIANANLIHTGQKIIINK